MKDKDFIAYEYKSVTVKTKDQQKAVDIFEAFGWEVAPAAPSMRTNVTLSLRRNRKQKHRQELVRLERQAENVAETIQSLNRAKSFGANIFSYIFGSAAVLVFGGGMSLAMLATGAIQLAGGLILGVAGLTLCAINYFIYRKIVLKKTADLLPVIDDNEEKLSNILEQGNALLSSDLI